MEPPPLDAEVPRSRAGSGPRAGQLVATCTRIVGRSISSLPAGATLHSARRLLRDVADLCYPAACAACRASCDAGQWLCPACSCDLTRLAAAPACDLCAMPLATADAPCPHCAGSGVAHYDRIFRLGTFEDPLKNLVHQMKYHGRWTVAEQLAELLVQQERIKGLLTYAQALVPVPLHRLRELWRGYNQAQIIAARIGRQCSVPLAHPLVRVRHTETQTHLHSRARRFENLKDAFRLVKPQSISGKHVVVIDDVMTTGATLQTIARALRPAKPASLCALILAVADPRGRDFQVV